ncbi:type 4a pilus biogenesis protein PilO [Paenibacillus tarimensis]|uniref:type 4a pilus biogenesis protein PilO n=1 Tax=Paenibacillus tarimensis TaxID=416012 RepID=UPI001F36C396|nr:type 4a pilus biogenesis protein PilO [Paenibacillus tarimensis]MCF2943432.1 type 4a pilus biogenesis protein PilO [Paenibacillus tarimensis]
MEQLRNNRQALILAATVMLLVLLAGVVYLILPGSRAVDEQEAEITALSSQFQLLENKLAEREREASGLDMADVQAALPLWDNSEQLLLDLQQLENDTGVELMSSTFTLAAPAADNQTTDQAAGVDSGISGSSSMGRVQLSLVVSGTYQDLLNWMDGVQSLPRLITIESFAVSKPQAAEVSWKPITVNVTLTAYYDPSYRGLVDEVLWPFGS